MNGQNQQQMPSGESTQTQQLHQDSHIRAPYVTNQVYHGHAVGSRDVNAGNISQLFSGLSLQNQRTGPNLGSIKGGLVQSVAPNIDLPGFQRSPCNGQYMILPNGTMIGGMPQATHFAPHHLPGHDQVNSLQYAPANIYSGFVPGASVITGNIQGYPWPYPVNTDITDLNTRGSTLSAEENKGSSNSVGDAGGQQNYYPTVAAIERSALAGYAYGLPSLPQIIQPYLQYQMMKTSNGYVLQDLEALTQQDPPIPRAVPAMWTNPSDLTLAKCLENREGITNVYIRGFLPETTDEMLHAYASRFGKIERCKAIIDLETGLCKG
jgi:RNA recognition motif. (a.k.a. RRM, RBD, or RNP domain)